MQPEEERERLARTFDRAARIYQRARPEYPEALFEDVVATTGVRPGDRLLEVGCATGKATLPLARRGFKITCVEPGPNLAALARENLRAYDVQVVESSFEEWQADTDERFSLVFAATAWKWLDPSIRYRRAWDVLRPGGHLAFWDAQHVFPEGSDPFFYEIQEIYDEIGEGLPADAVWPAPGELPEETFTIEETGLFDVVHVRHFDWEVQYDASGYLDLLDTFSGHIAMHDVKREHLYREIRKRLAARPDGLLRRHWGAVLHIARRRDRSAGDAFNP